MFVTKALARLTMCAGLMALPSAIPTAVYAQQTVAVGATGPRSDTRASS